VHLTRWQLVKLLSRKEKERERWSEKAQSLSFVCLLLARVLFFTKQKEKKKSHAICSVQHLSENFINWKMELK
jgi:hypothetical protein